MDSFERIDHKSMSFPSTGRLTVVLQFYHLSRLFIVVSAKITLTKPRSLHKHRYSRLRVFNNLKRSL